ncbi:MAG: hypothetical protein KKB50_14640 [Planctomycetes bacterium]|nr:hypothetical protein [Planctomycetota bacterium]
MRRSVRERDLLNLAIVPIALLLGVVPLAADDCFLCADLNGDGAVNGFDIDFFIECLNNNGCGKVAHWYFDEESGDYADDLVCEHDGIATPDVTPSADVPPCGSANRYSRLFPGDYNGGNSSPVCSARGG